MIDWDFIEYQSAVMQFENEIEEAVLDGDFRTAYYKLKEFIEFKEANKLFEEL